MGIKISETTDSDLSVNKDIFTILNEKETYCVKTIHISKEEPFIYAFIGGMWYSKEKFEFTINDISLPYPFTSYYTLKILDEDIDNACCRSSIYVKMPVLAIQFPRFCHLIKFDPILQIKDQDVFLFITLKETKESYDIGFYLKKTIRIKEKEQEWLGRGKKKKINYQISPGDSFQFTTTIKTVNRWEDGIFSLIHEFLPTQEQGSLKKDPKSVFYQAKEALWRSYDHKIKTFLQLPWRKTPGFTFVNSSYSLLSYEAVRLEYFSRWYEKTKDEDFRKWMNGLINLFLDPALHTIPKKRGEGIIWYNMTTLAKNGLIGYFYMDTGYSGYPGGQATIDLYLLKYLLKHPHKKLEHLVQQSLRYILSTQKENGSWPMAIKQEGMLKFRPEKLHQFTSYGGSAEATNALLLGSSYFDDSKMEAAAKKGLSFLKEQNPICYNGLRDIGIMEPEAFSAVSIINMYLDAYDHFSNKEYLQLAKTYAGYTLPWIYQWETKKLSFAFNFHPISYSITPRLSPYETAWIISTYHRLSKYTKEAFWDELNTLLFNHVTSWISQTGGLSEGIFPKGFSGFERLPMEQTFAIVELMNSAETMLQKPLSKPSSKLNRTNSLSKSVHLEKKDGVLTLKKDDEVLFSFNESTATITQLRQGSLNDLGITLSCYGSYFSTGLKRTIKKSLRGNYGKFLLSSKDALYALTGVKGPVPAEGIEIDLLKNHIVKSEINISSDNKAVYTCDTIVHHIQILFTFTMSNDELLIDMVIKINVKMHDLSPKQQIIFPLIGAKPVQVLEERINFKDFSVLGNLKNIIQTESFTGINQTLSTNWTHAGTITKEFRILVPL